MSLYAGGGGQMITHPDYAFLPVVFKGGEYDDKEGYVSIG